MEEQLLLLKKVCMSLLPQRAGDFMTEADYTIMSLRLHRLLLSYRMDGRSCETITDFLKRYIQEEML